PGRARPLRAAGAGRRPGSRTVQQARAAICAVSGAIRPTLGDPTRALNCAPSRPQPPTDPTPSMSWLKKLMPPRIRTETGTARKRSVPEGLWEKCERCSAVLYGPELEENLEVCPKCSFHRPIRARARLRAFLDPGELREIAGELGPTDVLRFRDQKRYADRIKAAQKSTGERDALIVMEGRLKQMPMVAAAFDFAYMGGSMGSVVGERFARGAGRLQASLFSLMLMARTAAALGRLRAAGLPRIPVMTRPTAGGVSASFAMRGDVSMPEPHALIGFAGPRVIEQTVRETLPEG